MGKVCECVLFSPGCTYIPSPFCTVHSKVHVNSVTATKIIRMNRYLLIQDHRVLISSAGSSGAEALPFYIVSPTEFRTVPPSSIQ